MALTVVTLRPTSTAQLGTGTVVGAASAHAALADASDASYVQVSSRSRLDSERVRVGFSAPSLPAGAQVYSVGLRRRVQTVVAGQPQPVCHHWLRAVTGLVAVAGQVATPKRSFFNSTIPTSPTVSAWVEESLGTYTVGPGGEPWEVATNLAALAYEIGRGDDAVTALRVSAVYLDVTYQAASTVTATGPTGSTTATRPTVTWTYASPDSQPQQAYRVAVYTAAQVAAGGFAPFVTTPVQESGWLLGEDLQWTLGADITDGSYRAYVQASARWAGTGEFLTATSWTAWTRAAAPATPPPAAVLSSAVFDAASNRVALTFVRGGTTPATTAYTVEASRDGGITWAPIPSLSYLPAAGATPIVGYDQVAPLNVTSRYRVIAYTGSPLVAAASPSNVLTATPTGDEHWLKHPGNPLLNTRLPVAAPRQGEGIKVTKRRTQGTFQPLGGAGSEVLPIVVSGPTHGDELQLELVFVRGETDHLWAAVDQLDRTGAVLLLQRPDGDQLWVSLGPGASGQETEEAYDALPGSPQKVLWRRRRLTLTQVAPPTYY